jgi:transcriptional regulator with XRE-family HTH domain
MNRILYVARKAKGLSAIQLANLLQIAENEYNEIEHSITDVTALQVLKLSKVFDVDPEMFLYNDGRDKRLVKYATDEVSKIITNVQAEQVPTRYYFHMVSLGNTALSLQAELGHALYRQYELEKDNEALRQMIESLKTQLP